MKKLHVNLRRRRNDFVISGLRIFFGLSGKENSCSALCASKQQNQIKKYRPTNYQYLKYSHLDVRQNDTCSDTIITLYLLEKKRQLINNVCLIVLNSIIILRHTFDKYSHKLLVPPDLGKNPQLFQQRVPRTLIFQSNGKH